MPHLAVVGQIWQDDCYYLDDQTGQCMRKFVLILAVNAQTGDSVTVVFTSKSNCLPETPTCYIGNPRSGYYLGVLGGLLNKPTWVDFNRLETLDCDDLKRHVQSGRKALINQTLNSNQLCKVLRCIMQIQADISKRDYRLLGDTIAQLNCT